jgi:small redox-active disulfide protein 2
MKIQVAGPGCPNCQNTERHVVNACAELDFAADISHVTSIADILDLGVLRTPAVVIDGEVVISGRVPTASELEKILETRTSMGPRSSADSGGGLDGKPEV